MTLDGIDFTFCSATGDRTEPENLIHEFMTLTIHFDGAAEFSKSATFKIFCDNHHIAMEATAAYTHTFNARAEGAARIVKEHMRCFLRCEPPTPFLAMRDAALLSRVRLLAGSARQKRVRESALAWASRDMPQRARDLHRFGSYVTDHLPRSHPLVDNERLDYRALDGE